MDEQPASNRVEGITLSRVTRVYYAIELEKKYNNALVYLKVPLGFTL